jgi:hypothetical protein
LRRVEEALNGASSTISHFFNQKLTVEFKRGGDPGTETERIANGAG